MKHLLYTFILLACTVLVCRHIVTDLRQEERIVMLENQVRDLLYKDVDDIENNNNNFADQMTVTPTISKKTSDIKNKSDRDKISAINKTSAATQAEINKDEERIKETQKFTQHIKLELNTVDSATLIKVPGIGAKTAGMIVRYREQLGGFHSVRQLEDRLTWNSAKDHMDEWCTRWFTADSSFIRPININTAEFRQILRHPYINYEQTKALVNYRDKHRRIEGMETLKMLEEFSDEDLQRLKRYITFD